MSIIQFWRIIWARRWFILAATVSCVIGAYVVTLILPPRWQGDARVMLNILKPDPVTGSVISGAGTRTYIGSQMSLITDYSVAGRAVEDVGWLSDPDLINQYQNRPATDTRDFRHWAAQLIIDRTKVEVQDGSNVLDIMYTSSSPDSARAVAEAVRKAYLETSLSLSRADSNRDADWFDVQALRAKSALEAAEAAEANYERANNVYMATSTMDVDSARLAALAGQSADGSGGPVSSGNSNAGTLAGIDAQIAVLSQTLGPNHPQLIALRAQRAALAAAGGGPIYRGSRNTVEAAAAAVVAKSDKLSKLRQLQAEVDLRRDIYNKTVAKAADSRQQAAIGDTGLTPMGTATVPAAPSFPNMPLIMFGSLGLGLALGFLVALLLELLNRRVRGPEDLQTALDVPLLAVVSAPG
jgi:succinoglycan biosynthesis transport protein ExoP